MPITRKFTVGLNVGTSIAIVVAYETTEPFALLFIMPRHPAQVQ